jgi:hypothetical protein
LIYAKNGLGNFFSNASGHPALDAGLSRLRNKLLFYYACYLTLVFRI